MFNMSVLALTDKFTINATICFSVHIWHLSSHFYLCHWSTTALEGSLQMILGLGSPVAEQFSLSWSPKNNSVIRMEVSTIKGADTRLSTVRVTTLLSEPVELVAIHSYFPLSAWVTSLMRRVPFSNTDILVLLVGILDRTIDPSWRTQWMVGWGLPWPVQGSHKVWLSPAFTCCRLSSRIPGGAATTCSRTVAVSAPAGLLAIHL